MNRKYIYPIIILFITVVLYYVEKNMDDSKQDYPKTNQKKVITSTEFLVSLLPNSTTNTIINHQFYSLSYSEKHEQAEWVAYELRKNDFSNNNFKRPYFVEDKKVKTKSAAWYNYKKSGYDKGHLCPAGDRTFKYDAYHETFLTSNISPQDHEFNAGIWNRLEQKTRYWAKKYDGVYVVTGGVLQKGLKTIGEERVSVPKEFYKIIIDKSDGVYRAIAFLMPNMPSYNSLYEYVVSIDAIEAKTGIDFFPKLSNEVEDKLEATINIKTWGKR